MNFDQLGGLVVTLLVTSGVLVLVIKQTYSDKDRINSAYSEGRAAGERHVSDDIEALRTELNQVRAALRALVPLIAPEHIAEAMVIMAMLSNPPPTQGEQP